MSALWDWTGARPESFTGQGGHHGITPQDPPPVQSPSAGSGREQPALAGSGREGGISTPEPLPSPSAGRDRDDVRRLAGLVEAAVASIARGRHPRIATGLVPR